MALSVCLHYKQGDVSASFRLRLTAAQEAKPTVKLLSWFAAAERRRRAWDVGQLVLVDVAGRCLDLDAPIGATVARLVGGDGGEAVALVLPWLHERTMAGARSPKVADAWALFCPIEKLVLYDRTAAVDASSPKLSGDDAFYLRFLRKLHGSGAVLGSEREAGFKKLKEGEAQDADWRKEKTWQRRGGHLWDSCVTADVWGGGPEVLKA